MDSRAHLTAAEIAFILQDCAQDNDDAHEQVNGLPSLANWSFLGGDAQRLSKIRQRMADGRPIPADWIRWLFEKYLDV